MLSKLICFLAGVIVAIGITARSADAFLEYGQCRFGQSGLYYDKQVSQSIYLTPRCASIGISDRFKSSSWGYRVAYIKAGSVQSRDNVAEMNDGHPTPYPCSQEHMDNCHSQVGGSGSMWGVSVSLTKTYGLGKHWSITGEAGALFFQHTFDGYAKPIDFDGSVLVHSGNGGFTGTGQRLEGNGLRQTSSIFNNPIPMAGLTLGYRKVYLAARHYFPAEHREGLSVTDHSFTQLAAGVWIPL